VRTTKVRHRAPPAIIRTRCQPSAACHHPLSATVPRLRRVRTSAAHGVLPRHCRRPAMRVGTHSLFDELVRHFDLLEGQPSENLAVLKRHGVEIRRLVVPSDDAILVDVATPHARHANLPTDEVFARPLTRVVDVRNVALLDAILEDACERQSAAARSSERRRAQAVGAVGAVGAAGAASPQGMGWLVDKRGS